MNKALAALQSKAPLPSFLVQRKCACGNASAGKMCDDCRHKQKTLQGRASDDEYAGIARNAQSNAFKAPRFGHDFGDMHVHTDAHAAAPAANARADTPGREVALGRFACQ